MLDNTTLLMKFIQGECSEEELEQVNEYIRQSGTSGRELFELRQLDRALKSRLIPSHEVDAAYERLRARLASKQEETLRHRRHVRLVRIWRVAAAIALLGILAAVTLFPSGEKMLTAQVLGDSVTRVTLADGSKVWLRQGASLTYPETFKGSTRSVKLTGEGYFEVSKDKAHPFVVKGGALNVKVLGTKFTFRSKGGSSQVSLLEGSVQVDERKNSGRVVLSPGQIAMIDSKTGTLKVNETHHVYYNAIWHDGKIPFKDVNIAQIVDELQYIYNVKIRLEGSCDLHTTYNGVVNREPRVEDVLKALSFTMPITYSRQGDQIIVRQSE